MHLAMKCNIFLLYYYIMRLVLRLIVSLLPATMLPYGMLGLRRHSRVSQWAATLSLAET